MQTVNQPKARVLIADDSKEVAARLFQMLSPLEHVEVIGPARDGGEARELYLKHKPHAAVLDFQMPMLTGLELVEIVRREDADCLVLILTSHESPEVQNRCLEAGANHFLHKSTDFERVVEIIADFVQKRIA